MADIDKFLGNTAQSSPYVTHEQFIKILESVVDSLSKDIEERVSPLYDFAELCRERFAHNPLARPLEEDRYLLEVVKTLLTHSAEDSPEEQTALRYLRNIVDATLPPEVGGAGVDQGADSDAQGSAEGDPGREQGDQPEDLGVAAHAPGVHTEDDRRGDREDTPV
jgi:hypothetical protein